MQPPVDVPGVRAWFDEVTALDPGPVVSARAYAGVSVTVRAPDDDLVAALSGAAPAASPDYEVRVVDGRIGPSPPADLVRGGVERVYVHGSDLDLYAPSDGPISAVDHGRGLGLWWLPDRATIPGWEIGAPLRTVLHFALARRRRLLAHASAVVGPSGGALLVGAGGSGKSTTALIGFHAGLGYVADDYCVLDAATRTVHSAFRSVKIDGRSRRIVADVDLPHLCSSSDGKEIYLAPTVGEAVPLVGLVAPAVEERTVSLLERVSGGELLRSGAPSTLFQQPGYRAEGLQAMATLARHVPAYRLVLGSHVGSVSGRLHDLVG